MTQQEVISDVFLCHNRADKDWVRALGEQIESETFDGTASGRPLRVFFDEWDINVGENVPEKLNRALKGCRYVAIVISPEMLAAPWPTFEWTHVVAEDPINSQGRIIPVYLRHYSENMDAYAELPAPFKALNWVDFRRPKDFRRSFQKLIRRVRDQPPARGRRRKPLASTKSSGSDRLLRPSQEASASPDQVSDIVLSNLLPVEDFPKTVWFAPTEATMPKDIYDHFKSPSPFILQERKLFTFADLSIDQEPFREVIDTAKIKSKPIGEWRDDEVRWRWIVAIFNRCLRSHFHGLPFRRDTKGRYFFLPDQEGARCWKNGSDPERTVADQKTNSAGEVFWVHHGARLAFSTLGDSLFLCVEPCYIFTSDGITPLEGKSVGPLSIKWGGKERNAAVLRHVVFWGRTLTKDSIKIEIATGALPITISAIPAFAKTTFGIEFDHINIRSLIDQAEAEDELARAAEAVVSNVSIDGFDSEMTDD